MKETIEIDEEAAPFHEAGTAACPVCGRSVQGELFSIAALPPRALFSSVVALIGVIATDYLLRRLQKSGHTLSLVTYWIIGVIALVPAWLIALVGF